MVVFCNGCEFFNNRENTLRFLFDTVRSYFFEVFIRSPLNFHKVFQPKTSVWRAQSSFIDTVRTFPMVSYKF